MENYEPIFNITPEILTAVYEIAAELANELYNAVENSKEDDFRGNIVKIRIIKKALYKVLKNDSEVERAYELVNVQKEF